MLPRFLVTLALAGTVSGTPPQGKVVILTRDELRLVAADDWKTIWSLPLQDVAPLGQRPTRRMQMSGDAIYMLTAHELLKVDAASGDVVARRTLAAGKYDHLTIQANTGMIVVCGNEGADAVFLTLDPQSSKLVELGRVKSVDGKQWYIYQCTWATDRPRLYVTYHGQRTGMDWFDVQDDHLKRCENRRRPTVGCIDAHAAFVQRHQGFFLATGGPEITLVTPNGSQVKSLNVGDLGHLMEFQVSRDGNDIYAAGACGYIPGFVHANHDSIVSKFYPSYRSTAGNFCSDQLTILNDTTLLTIVKASRHLDTVDPRTAAKATRVEMHGDILDVLVLSPDEHARLN